MTFDIRSGGWAIAALLGGPVLFVHGFRDLRIRRLIRDTPNARIRSMAMGMVEISGAVTPRSQLSAPFSARPCAHWEVDIAVRRDRRSGWSIVHRNSSGNPFYLRDETGVAMVYPQNSECKLNFGVSEETGGLGVPEIYSQYMAAQGLAMRHIWQLGPMRFRERMLEDSQAVFVLGRAFPRSQSVSVSADDEELAATGTEGAPAVTAMRASRLGGLDHEVTAVVRRGEGDPVFLISQESERQVQFELGWKATAEMIGGPILTVIGLGYWLYQLSQMHVIK